MSLVPVPINFVVIYAPCSVLVLFRVLLCEAGFGVCRVCELKGYI